MNGSIRQRSAGSWQFTVDLGRDSRAKRRRKWLTVRGTKALIPGGESRQMPTTLHTLPQPD